MDAADDARVDVPVVVALARVNALGLVLALVREIALLNVLAAF